jgi:hypothetical protein
MDILSNPAEAPRADPHAGCCGGWGLNTPGYPIRAQIRLLAGSTSTLKKKLARRCRASADVRLSYRE